MPRLDELKARLAQVDALIADGVLTGEPARQARDALEAQVLAAVLQPAAASTQAPDVQAAPAARPSRRLWLGLATFVLAFGVAGYAWLGNPAGLAMAPGVVAGAAAGDPTVGPAEIEAMAKRLADRLEAKPDDAEGWAMLGRSYSVLERFPQAVAAYRRLVALRPQDAQAHADLADAVGMANGRVLDGEPGALVARALELDADNLKALSLAGTIAFNRGEHALAARHWERGLRQVDPAGPMAAQLQAVLADARNRAGLPPLAAAGPGPGPGAAAVPRAAPATLGASAAAAAASDASVQVQVRVTLAPALAARAAPDDTVFIFARAPQGSKMPLAIQRRQVKDLPLELTLDDSMAMSPALRLSGVQQVVVGARVSKSGNAMPQPGDLQGLSAAVAVGTRGLQLQIGEVVR